MSGGGDGAGGGGDATGDAGRQLAPTELSDDRQLRIVRPGADDGPAEARTPYLRFDSTALVDVNDKLSFDGLFQFKARQPRPADDPNRDLFINQGAGRRVGGKFKELYVPL